MKYIIYTIATYQVRAFQVCQIIEKSNEISDNNDTIDKTKNVGRMMMDKVFLLFISIFNIKVALVNCQYVPLNSLTISSLYQDQNQESHGK